MGSALGYFDINKFFNLEVFMKFKILIVIGIILFMGGSISALEVTSMFLGFSGISLIEICRLNHDLVHDMELGYNLHQPLIIFDESC